MDNVFCIQLLVIDVDGTMTDGGIYYDTMGNEIKKFNTKDAAGIIAAHFSNIKTMVLTGRESPAVEKRMKELRVDYVIQGVLDKRKYLLEFMKKENISQKQIGYIGDDLNDLPMKLSGYIACPADACDEVKQIADYVSPSRGGHGAVRECIMHMLKKRGQWKDAIEKAYNIGT